MDSRMIPFHGLDNERTVRSIYKLNIRENLLQSGQKPPLPGRMKVTVNFVNHDDTGKVPGITNVHPLIISTDDHVKQPGKHGSESF